MLFVPEPKQQDQKPAVIFRVDGEMKQLLEDIALASGYATLTDFMLDVAKGIIENVDPKVMATVREIQSRRAIRSTPKVKSPKDRTERQGTKQGASS